MRGYTIVVLLVCLATPAWSQTKAEEVCASLDDLVTDISKVEIDVEELADQADYIDLESNDLAQRVDKLEGVSCESFYSFQCGFPRPRCISHYLVCDGSPDCPNGADEQFCEMTLPAKAYWEATAWDIPFYSCLDTGTVATMARSTLTISEDPLAPSMPMVTNVNLETYDDGSTWMWRDAGFYSYANRAFVFWGPTWPGFCYGRLDKRNSKQMIVHCANGQDPTSFTPCCRYNYQLKEILA